MNAKEARKLTRSKLEGPLTDDLYEAVMLRVKSAPKFSVHEPFGAYTEVRRYGHKYTMSAEEEAVLRVRLAEEGYIIVDHPDPDPGNPCSHPYTTMSW